MTLISFIFNSDDGVMSTRVLKILIIITGALGLYAFLAVRSELLFNLTFREKVIPEYWENTKYGELYYFNHIKNFREEGMPATRVKYRHTDKHPALQEADVLIFGDSFMDFSRMVTFPERLSDTLNAKVYYERFFDDHRPLITLGEAGYKNSTPKIMIYESAERYIPHRFSNPHIEESLPSGSEFGVKQLANSVIDWIFLEDAEVKLTTMLNRSILTTDIHSLINTFKFNTFGYIPSTTPDYAFDDKKPWLFYYEEVNEDSTSYYYQFTDEQINTYCDNIAGLAATVKQKYNLDMVFMPLPSKYTVYHKLINDDPYNNFLPRLFEGLSERGVTFVNVYDDYKSSDEILYYGTDTHWNQKGLDIALDETLEVVEGIGYQVNYLITENSKNK